MMVPTSLQVASVTLDPSRPAAAGAQAPFQDWLQPAAVPAPPVPPQSTGALAQPVTPHSLGLPTQSVVPPAPADVVASVEPNPELGGDVTVLLELQVRDARGAEELVAVPWRLAGTGHLAQETTTGHPSAVAQGQRSGAEPVRRGAEIVQMPDGPGLSVSTVSIAGANVNVRPTSLAVPHPRTPVAESAPAVTAPPQPHAPGMPASPIAVRLMRWLEGPRQLSTVWIRDYRLDEAGVNSLIHALRQMTAAEGLELERIVVNAREVWRAPAAATALEAGPCR